MDIRFDGKRALVTGAGKGIGRDTAKMLAKCGAEVFALSRTQADLDSLKQEVPSIKTICVDLRDREKTQTSVEAIGPIDLLVNNAAIIVQEPFLEVTPKCFEDMMDVNVRSVIQVSQIAARTMISRRCGGAIVNISSQTSLRGMTNYTSYAASKAALDSITKTMALELGPKQIRVNSVNPTAVYTAMAAKWELDYPAQAKAVRDRIPLGRFAEVKEVVSVILFMLSDRSAMVNGTILPIDGGFVIAGI